MTTSARIAAEAERIIQRVRRTHYQYEAVIDPETGTYNCDCSAFVGYVLGVVAPRHLSMIPRVAGAQYPLAYEFFDFFSIPQLPLGWRRISAMSDVRPGDVFAWRAVTIRPGKDTGHVFIVGRTPEFDASADAWDVGAIDSSNVPHFDDSRERGGVYRAGVGTGVIRFVVNDGAPVGFQFGPEAKVHALPIVVARLDAFQASDRSNGKRGTAAGSRIERDHHGAGDQAHESSPEARAFHQA